MNSQTNYKIPVEFQDDKVVVVGGAGHVGLPLSIMLASRGLDVTIYDLSAEAETIVNSGRLPFIEPNAEPILRDVLSTEQLRATTNPESISEADVVIFVIGTPVDEHLNPDPNTLPEVIRVCLPYMRTGQLIILRSTIYPGVTAMVREIVNNSGMEIDLAFCPERIAEHNAVEELTSLPQIVASHTQRGKARASQIFSRLTGSIVELSPEEAELAKLFTNTWRYIKFAAANQFYMMANDRALDYERIREAVRFDYPRAADLPSAGFAAGPCLFKDTMQLAAFSDNSFQLGHSAMLINEGLPLYVISRLEKRFDLKMLRVGILGMAFKGESDDTRSSLSYKLKRALKFRAKAVLCTDEYVSSSVDSDIIPLETVLEQADLLIIAAPHKRYKELRPSQPVADIWGHLGTGVII